MAPESNNNWLSFSLSSMEMLNNSSVAASSAHHHVPNSGDSHHYYSFADNFYATGWPNQKAHTMYSETTTGNNHHQDQAAAMYAAGYMQPSPKLEDFFAGGDSTETQDSSLTHMYDHHQQQQQGVAYYDQDLKGINGFQSFSANSGSEVDDSGFGGQTQSPGESGSEFVAYSSHCHQINTVAASNGLSLGVNVNNNNNVVNVNTNSSNNHAGNSNNDGLIVSSSNNNNNNSTNDKTAIVPVDSETSKKVADTFGQRTSIYRGVTRHRWTGRYEAHLWDNSCRREGQARKGRQVYLGGYDKEDKAARAYDLAALKYWGPTATTNFPISTYSKEMEEMKHVTKQEFIASLRRKSSGFSRGASIYRGVTRHHQQGRWQARIGRVAGNKDLYLGTFATEEEAAEAYDIAAIKFRGINAVTNFEMNRYDVEAISKSPLPIGGAAKRLKISMEGEEKQLALGNSVQTPCSSISFSAIQPSNIPCGIPFDNAAAPYYHHNLFHHYNQQNGTDASNSATPMPLLPPPAEFFIWPQQNY